MLTHFYLKIILSDSSVELSVLTAFMYRIVSPDVSVGAIASSFWQDVSIKEATNNDNAITLKGLFFIFGYFTF